MNTNIDAHSVISIRPEALGGTCDAPDYAPTTASTAGRLGFIRAAWMALDVAMVSLDEIRFVARQRKEFGVQYV